jgi:CelD/BcsL family acetyltransferase involved in cellulose biosynthesis
MVPSLAPAPMPGASLSRRPAAAPTFRLAVHEDIAAFDGLWPRTDTSPIAASYVFQRADLLAVWRDTIGAARATQPVFTAIFDRHDRPLMLLPLGIERRHGIRILGFLDGGVCDYNAPVLFPGGACLNADDMRQVWEALTRVLPPFDLALFDKMPGEIRGMPNPLLELGARVRAPSGHVATLDGTWEEFSAKRLPRRRHTLRKRRRLTELGNLRFTIAATAAERARLFDATMRQKSRQLAEIRGASVRDPGFREFYSALAADPHGPVHLSGLQVDDNVIATHLGLLAENRFYFLVPAYEGGEWSRFSAGRILIEDLIEWCFANRVEIFDFGIGDEPYKLEYRDRDLPLYQAVIPVTVSGRAVAAAAMARRQFRSALRTARTWSLPKSPVVAD